MDALEYACEVINALRGEIRAQSALLQAGFCQGVIFRDALSLIRRRAVGEKKAF
jgi:hypothetical protein